MCNVLENPAKSNAYLGHLNHEEHRFCFHPPLEKPPTHDPRDVITLESILLRTPREQAIEHCVVLSRQERYNIALTLASSFLQLHSTPWLPPQWTKKDIQFIKLSDNTISIDHPYISRESAPISTSSSRYSDRAIHALGVVLLELCFGTALEDHHIRKSFLGPDGKPNPALDLVVAKEWCDMYAEGEAGAEFANAIAWCLRYRTGSRNVQSTDKGWKEPLLSSVVLPLQHCFNLMTKGASA